jgi:hypothetical protein
VPLPVKARQRWFISSIEGERIARPRLHAQHLRTADEARSGGDDQG